MSDWTDEVRARMVREEERLRYKAANLQARGKTVMAAQELVVADDIRAALEEIERLTQDLADIVENDTGQAARAEAAEAEVERLEADGILLESLQVATERERDAARAKLAEFRATAEAAQERMRLELVRVDGLARERGEEVKSRGGEE